jgi:hypothetical protein
MEHAQPTNRFRPAAGILPLLFCVVLACESAPKSTPVSTLDSNIEKMEAPLVPDLDNPADSNFSIALDTPGPTVDPEDTITRQKPQQ